MVGVGVSGAWSMRKGAVRPLLRLQLDCIRRRFERLRSHRLYVAAGVLEGVVVGCFLSVEGGVGGRGQHRFEPVVEFDLVGDRAFCYENGDLRVDFALGVVFAGCHDRLLSDFGSAYPILLPPSRSSMDRLGFWHIASRGDGGQALGCAVSKGDGVVYFVC